MRRLLIISISYSEAIEFLYSSNYMLMSNVRPPFVLPHLTSLLLPQRLNSIRHLRINWSVDHYIYRTNPDFTEWFAGWDSLCKLEGLHYLHIRIRNSHLLNDCDAEIEEFFYEGWDAWNTHSTAMFEPVKRVKALKKFVVTLPNTKCSTDFDVGTSNCQFRLPVK